MITTLKEGGPLIRYRTHDLTRLDNAHAGAPNSRHDRIQGRTDDMVKVKGREHLSGTNGRDFKSIDGVAANI